VPSKWTEEQYILGNKQKSTSRKINNLHSHRSMQRNFKFLIDTLRIFLVISTKLFLGSPKKFVADCVPSKQIQVPKKKKNYEKKNFRQIN
jgi:hypothetical protein